MIPRVHVVAADADKFFVNAFLIEGARELILVDTHFLVSSARRVVAAIETLGKPLAAIVITHPHPDHYNGLPIVLEAHPGVPVFANPATIQGIRATQAAKREAWAPVYGDDYPSQDGIPDHEIGPDGTLDVAGISLQLIDLGGCESAIDNAALHVPEARALIASDLIYSRCHPWLAEHRTAAWLDQLDDLEHRFADIDAVFAGHGTAGGAELFEAQRRYIRDFRTLVGRHSINGRLNDAALAEIKAQTREGRADWPLEGLIEMNAFAVAEELAQ